MTCVKSDDLCESTSPSFECYCCTEVPDRPCQDYGCREFFNGQGRCLEEVNQNSVCVESGELCCDGKVPVITDVTCKFTVDNIVTNVQYDGNVLPVTGTTNNWQHENTVSFTTSPSGFGELRITGEDYNDIHTNNHCVWGGLLLKCEAADTNSPWHNFMSDTANWRADGGSPICTNNLGFVAAANGNIPFIQSLIASGAKKIWIENETVTLIGGPKHCRCCMNYEQQLHAADATITKQ